MRAAQQLVPRPAHALRVAPREHPLEQAAQRHVAPPATQAARPSHGAMAGPLPLPGGEPLRVADRQRFERHYGCDFASVRLHADDRAADASRRLRAKAFTSGTNIGFGAGRYRPGSPAGQDLLGHELAHVAQAMAGGPGGAASKLVWRAPEDESTTDHDGTVAPTVRRLSVDATTNPDAVDYLRNVLVAGAEARIDMTSEAFFEGDVLAIGLRQGRASFLTIDVDSLPPELERSDLTTDSRLMLRVLAPAEAVTLHLRTKGDHRPSAIVTLRLQARPSPGADIDPLESIRALRKERRGSRRKRRVKRRELPGQAREDRQQARSDRRSQRRTEQTRARELRQERRGLSEEHSCSQVTLKALSEARGRGVEVCDAALAALATRPLPAAAAVGLQRYMKIDAPTGPGAKAPLQRITDVLSTARNSLAEADNRRFVCADAGCGERDGAFVTDFARGGEVTICPLWRDGQDLKFEPAPGIDEARAYSLVHEFVHLSGPSAKAERYVSDKNWLGVTTSQALTMADAYAAVAWAAGSGKKP